MSESDMRRKVILALKPLHAVAVENPALPGTPDINYIVGWIECKWLRKWPVRETTVIPFEHFTPQQRVWHLQRRSVGGKSWMLVQCRREWLLFDGAVAALNFGTCHKTALKKLAEFYWKTGLEGEELIKCLSRKQRDFYLTEDVKEKLRNLLQNATVFPSIDT